VPLKPFVPPPAPEPALELAPPPPPAIIRGVDPRVTALLAPPLAPILLLLVTPAPPPPTYIDSISPAVTGIIAVEYPAPAPLVFTPTPCPPPAPPHIFTVIVDVPRGTTNICVDPVYSNVCTISID
jgi:hypothetical protein